MTTGGYPASAARVPRVVLKAPGRQHDGRAGTSGNGGRWSFGPVSGRNRRPACRRVLPQADRMRDAPLQRSDVPRRESPGSARPGAVPRRGRGARRQARPGWGVRACGAPAVRFFKDGTRSRMVDVPRSGGRRSPQTSIDTWPGRAPVALRVSRMAKSCVLTRPTRWASRAVSEDALQLRIGEGTLGRVVRANRDSLEVAGDLDAVEEVQDVRGRPRGSRVRPRTSGRTPHGRDSAGPQ